MSGSQKNYLPFGWHLALAVGLIGGIVLARTHVPPIPGIERVSARIPAEVWWKVVGVLLVAAATTHWTVSLVLKGLRSLFDLREATDNARIGLWPPAFLGVLEAIMYPVALIAGHADFIGLWLLLKVASQWPGWGLRESDKVDELDRGRRRYYHFLIGNALMVLAGVVTYGVLKAIGIR